MSCSTRKINTQLRFDKYCPREINFSLPEELQKILNNIPGMNPISFRSEKVQIIELQTLFNCLTNKSTNVCDPESHSGLKMNQLLALERCKLNIMQAVYDDILLRCQDEQDLEIAKKMREKAQRKEEKRAKKNVWWKKIIPQIDFAIPFVYTIVCEFFGYAAMMSDMLGLAATTLNPATIIFAIPMTLISLLLYIATVNKIFLAVKKLFGFNLAEEKKERLTIIEEQIKINDKINSLLKNEDLKESITASDFRGYATMSMRFNHSIKQKKDDFQPNKTSWMRRLYWILTACLAATLIGSGYYAAISLLGMFALVGVVVPPIWVAVTIGVLILGLLFGLLRQSKAIEQFLTPNFKQEQTLRDKLDEAYIVEDAFYSKKIQNKSEEESEPKLAEDNRESNFARLVEHHYPNVKSHEVIAHQQENRPRSKSLNFAPGQSHKRANQESMDITQDNPIPNFIKNNAGF